MCCIIVVFVFFKHMTAYELRISNWSLDVCSSGLRFATAETFDVIVEPSGQDAFTIFAQDMGRTGYVAGTLAVREGLRAPVPQVDPRPILTMDDMGHGMMMGGGMDHSMAGMSGGAMAGMSHAGMEDRKSVVEGKSVSVSVDIGGSG